MPDPLGRSKLFELHDPFAMHGGIQQGREPQQAGQMRFFLHDIRNRRVWHLRDLRGAHTFDIVVEALESETVQVHEVTWHVETYAKAPVLALQCPHHEPFDQHGRVIADVAARNQAMPAFEGLDFTGHRLELGFLGFAHVLPQSPRKKMAGLWI